MILTPWYKCFKIYGWEELGVSLSSFGALLERRTCALTCTSLGSRGFIWHSARALTARGKEPLLHPLQQGQGWKSSPQPASTRSLAGPGTTGRWRSTAPSVLGLSAVAAARGPVGATGGRPPGAALRCPTPIAQRLLARNSPPARLCIHAGVNQEQLRWSRWRDTDVRS